jgi:hypothetical protein
MDPIIPEKDAEIRRIDTLLKWHDVFDERITRLLIIIIVLSIFYVYYALVAPWLMSGRLESIDRAREDLERIIKQYQSLRERYSELVLPPVAAPNRGAREMGRFSDLIIPAIRLRLNKDSQLPISERDAKLTWLVILERDMGYLSDLFNQHQVQHGAPGGDLANNPNQEFRRRLSAFRRSLGIIMSTQSKPVSQPEDEDGVRDNQALEELRALLVGASDSHLGVLNDPVNDLANLTRLEGIIADLRAFDTTSDNSTLCEEGRLALTAESANGEAIHLGDTLLRSFPPYIQLDRYTPLRDGALKFEPSFGLDSYRNIKDYLGAPFEVSTISDLYRLDEYAAAAIDRTNTEYRSPVLTIPFLNASIDRVAVLSAIPIFMVFLFHLVTSYSKRNLALIEHVDGTPTNALRKSDFKNYRLVLSATTTDITLTNGKLGRMASRVSDWIGHLLRSSIYLVPFLILGSFSYSLYDSWRTFATWRLVALVALALISFLFMGAEAYMAWLYLSRQGTSIGLREKQTKTPTGETRTNASEE